MFDREIGFPNEHHSYKVKANQTLPQDSLTTAVYLAPPNTDAATPAYSPDGLVVTLGKGTHTGGILDVRAYTVDPALAPPPPILNYPDTAFAVFGPHPVLSPRISPDGSRTALGSRQVWASRRNMNIPPQFTSVTSTNEGTRSIADTAATVSFTVFIDELSTITVQASDSESDAMTYRADFWQPYSWMVWDAPTRTLTFVATPSSAQGFYYLKFWVTTTSGGADAFIAIVKVASQTAGPSSPVRAGAGGPADGPNPTGARFAITAPFVPGASAALTVFDVSGRTVRVVRGPSGSQLVWDGSDGTGALVSPGIYLYRLDVGRQRREGKVVVMR